MFKVGDRVAWPRKPDDLGTVIYAHPDGKCDVRWDDGLRNGPYESSELLSVTWSVGQRVRRLSPGATSQVPADTLGTIDTVYGGVPTVRWDNGVSAGPYADTEISAVGTVNHTYKTGDRIRATCDHGEGIGLATVAARTGDVGEYVGSYPTMPFQHKVRFGRDTYYVNDEYIEPVADAPALSRAPLACVRCSDTNAYAEPNLPGGRYACFSCRKYHSYSLTNK